MAQTNLFATRRMSSQIYQDNLKKLTGRTMETDEVMSPQHFISSEDNPYLTKAGIFESTQIDTKLALFQAKKELRRVFESKRASEEGLTAKRQTVDSKARLFLREYIQSSTNNTNTINALTGRRQLLNKLIPGTASIEVETKPFHPSERNVHTVLESASDSEVKEYTIRTSNYNPNGLRSQASITKRVSDDSKRLKDITRNPKSIFAQGNKNSENCDDSGRIVSILRMQPTESKNNWSVRDSQRALTVGKKNVVFAAEKMPRSKVGFKDTNPKKRHGIWCCS